MAPLPSENLILLNCNTNLKTINCSALLQTFSFVSIEVISGCGVQHGELLTRVR